MIAHPQNWLAFSLDSVIFTTYENQAQSRTSSEA